MKFFMLCFLLVRCVGLFSLNYEIEGVLSHYKRLKTHSVKIFYVDNTPLKRSDVLAVASSCPLLESLAKKIKDIPWKNEGVKETLIEKECFCQKGVCFKEITDLFPYPINNRFDRNLSCHGPNCFNATLMAAGLFDLDQARMVTLDEISLIMGKYCQKIPLKELTAYDIVTLDTPEGRPFMHIGFYLENNFLFTKHGPAKNHFYHIENWSNLLKKELNRINVYRCHFDSSSYGYSGGSQKDDLSFRKLEKAFNDLVDCALSPLKVSSHLEAIENSLMSVVPYTQEDHVMIGSLKQSLNMNLDVQVR